MRDQVMAGTINVNSPSALARVPDVQLFGCVLSAEHVNRLEPAQVCILLPRTWRAHILFGIQQQC